MTNAEIYKAVMAELKAAPFITTNHALTTKKAASFKFKKRTSGYYLNVELHSWPSEHERVRKEFNSWLYQKLKPYGWVPYTTSGGCGEWTYRLDGGIEFDFGP
ncbi:hypothetical protein [Xanthomonas phage BUDD]|nr:hypothetical protein [Xanthomonas phage BUDD]